MGDIFGPNHISFDGDSQQRTAECERFHMELVHDYKEEIKFLSDLLEKTRKERTEFFGKTLLEIRKSIEGNGVSKEISEEWLRALEENMRNSFNMSDALIRHYFTKNLEEFAKKYNESEGIR